MKGSVRYGLGFFNGLGGILIPFMKFYFLIFLNKFDF